MKSVLATAIFLMLGQAFVQAASAASSTASGPAALALAAVVAEYSPILSVKERRTMARLFDDKLNFGLLASQKVSVKADSIVCRMSNVAIAERSCELSFGKRTRSLKGRQANELNATAAVAGIASEGAAGTIFTSFSHLACTIDPHEIKQKAGAGATCTFDTGP
jgi:hypothetical protein